MITKFSMFTIRPKTFQFRPYLFDFCYTWLLLYMNDIMPAYILLASRFAKETPAPGERNRESNKQYRK